MKAFLFNGEEYTDLNQLGLAFANQYELALRSIQEKSFLKFVHKFKKDKLKIKETLFQTRYLQNALSILIYNMTEDHLFIVGHKFYTTIKECLLDLKKNPALQFFAEDYGFSNTFLQTLEDEKLKADIQAYENHSRNDFAIDYIANYYTLDALESLEGYYKDLKSSDLFKSYLELFRNESYLKLLAQKTSLKEVLEMKEALCPVFKGVILAQVEQEQVLQILDQAFYLNILQDLKQYKYKKEPAKETYQQLKKLKKEYKKYSKLTFLNKVKWHENLYFCYLKFVDSFKLEKLVSKEEKFDFTIPYCDTYVSLKGLEETHILPDIEKEYQPLNYVKYDLKAFHTSFRNHFYFSAWGLFFVFLFGVYYGLSFMIPALKPAIQESMVHPANLIYWIGSGIAILLFLAILILRGNGIRKYKGLCKLAYYRKHKDLLSEKQYAEFEKLSSLEMGYAHSIDRYYRFYGGIAMAGVSVVISLLWIGILQNYVSQFLDIFKDTVGILETTYYITFIPAILCLCLGFLRHKKTAWSIWFTFMISIGISIGLVLLV